MFNNSELVPRWAGTNFESMLETLVEVAPFEGYTTDAMEGSSAKHTIFRSSGRYSWRANVPTPTR